MSYDVRDYSNEEPFYANLQDGGISAGQAGAWSSQFGGDGLNVPFYNTDMTQLQNVQPHSPVPYFEPALISQGPERQPASAAFIATRNNPGGTDKVGDFLAQMIPPMHNSVVDYWSPKAPTRRDNYAQSYQLSSGQYYAGTSPQRGIYTGVEDI